MKHGKRSRQIGALARLEAQLKSGVKPSKDLNSTEEVLLETKDIKRIQKEIESLKTKLSKTS